MKQYIYLLFVSLGLLLANIYQKQTTSNMTFEKWLSQYPVTLTSQELFYRRAIFQTNFAIIQKHNADPSQSYKMGINQFTIYTTQEFKQTFLGTFLEQSYVEADGPFKVTAEIDWTTKGKVSPIKNQGKCGSCWAFSATGVCESFSLINSKPISLSQQQLVDCTKSTGNHGCNGGSRQIALRYIKDHGIMTESEYPYEGKDGSCSKVGGSFKINNIGSVAGCTNINNALQSRPIGVAVDASNWGGYSSGIFSNCGSNINHAVLLVGVSGTYWKIKNSWGTGWGEHGFIRLALGNTCGMCNEAAVWPY